MIKNKEKFFKFEKKLIKKTKYNVKKNFEIFETLKRYYILLGRKQSNKVNSIEPKIRIARVLNEKK
ncbi:MAG: hypothetical protein ABIN11_05960 [candidate division WOR-3 bacterium]